MIDPAGKARDTARQSNTKQKRFLCTIIIILILSNLIFDFQEATYQQPEKLGGPTPHLMLHVFFFSNASNISQLISSSSDRKQL